MAPTPALPASDFAADTTSALAATVSTSIGRHSPFAELVVLSGVLLPLVYYPMLGRRRSRSRTIKTTATATATANAPIEDINANTTTNDIDTSFRFLQINSFLQLWFIHFPNLYILLSSLGFTPTDAVYLVEYTILPIWPIYVHLAILLALCHPEDFFKGFRNGSSSGHESGSDGSDEKPAPASKPEPAATSSTSTSAFTYTREYFKTPALLILSMLVFEIFRILAVAISNACMLSWTWSIVISFVFTLLATALLGSAFEQPLEDAIQTCLYRFVTRDVEGWDRPSPGERASGGDAGDGGEAGEDKSVSDRPVGFCTKWLWFCISLMVPLTLFYYWLDVLGYQ